MTTEIRRSQPLDAPAWEQALRDSAWDRILIGIIHRLPHLPTSFGVDALNDAIAHERFDVADAMLRLGVGVNERFRSKGSGDLFAPLHIAAMKNAKTDGVNLLLDVGASVDIRDDDGLTPLFYAVGKGSLAVIKRLVEAGADINAVDKRGQTPLFTAVQHNRNPDTVRLLLKLGAQPDHRDRSGITPMNIVRSMKHNSECVELLRRALAPHRHP